MSEKYYSIMRFNKLKTEGQITATYEHNVRIEDVPNADPEKAYLNEEFVRSGLSYVDAYKKRIQEVGIEKVRKNAVLALELNLTFTKDAEKTFSLENWKKAQVDWLEKTFNVAPDGKSNIISISYHGDESTPHMHAVVVPIDKDGKLKADSFVGDRKLCRELQKSYRDTMTVFGLEKEKKNKGKATHLEINQFYEGLKKAFENELPEIKKGETVEEYKERADKTLEAINANYYKEILDFKEHESEEIASLKESLFEQKDMVRELTPVLERYSSREIIGMVSRYEYIEAGIESLDDDERRQVVEGLSEIDKIGRKILKQKEEHHEENSRDLSDDQLFEDDR